MSGVPPAFVERLRAICAALPQVEEQDAWTGSRWRVRGRTFAHVLTIEDGWPPAYARAAGTDGPASVLMFRSAGPELDALRQAGPPFFTTPWRADELGLLLDAATDWAEVAELVADSYRVLAPRRLAAQVDGPAPATSGGARTILQLSDIHLVADPATPVNGHDADARLQAVLDAWHRTGRAADLVLLSGDIADDGSPGAYERVEQAVSRLGVPVLAIPGNHDDPHGVAQRFGDDAVVELGPWAVVGLDTARPHQVHGTLDVDAAMRLLDSLDDRPTAVAMHHPPASRSTHEWFQLDGAAAFLDGIARRPQVRVVMAGHLHDAFETDVGGATLLSAPSTLLAIAHDGDRMEIGADAPTGARVVTLHADGTCTSELLLA